MRALVWLKRDLRLRDHAALAAARHADAAAALYVIEPEWLDSPECDPAHVDFALDSLRELAGALARRGLPLLVRRGEATAVLSQLHRRFTFDTLLSHEETGAGWSFARDRRVAAWCRAQGVAWQECIHTGVVRRLRRRDGWSRRWQQRMDAPEADSDGDFHGASTLAADTVPTLRELGLAGHDRQLQPAGERAAWATLESFLDRRGHDYLKAISSPLRATGEGSRLSPHLAFGTLSMRCTHQATRAALARLEDAGARRALRGFAGRLRWHCHFMQKLEDQPDLEFRNLARYCDGLREDDFDDARFRAWCAGRTGFPMVDASMRFLRATGWVNFRMRAMLVSFASYHLWLHWRRTGLFLARQFLDFEPGIHWSQMQMQSGTTGINALRVYSPTKQARDHDPDGRFIRRWVPELARVPTPLLAEPWRMEAARQRQAGCRIGCDYPAPIVDEREAARQAKARLYARRREPDARAEAEAIQARHGSRRSGLASKVRRGKPRPTAQADLFET